MTEPPDISPLPGAFTIDEQIEAKLAEFDAIPLEVRRTAAIITVIVHTLPPSAVLSALGYVHLLACNERAEV
jgi:hypothetical protein